MKKIICIYVFLVLGITAFAQQTVGLFSTTPDVSPGYTLFGPVFSTNSYLIDNCGDLQYMWGSQYYPGGMTQLNDDGTLIRSCVYVNNSPIAAGGAGGRIEAIQPDQQLAWSVNLSNDTLRQHHDFEPLPNGNFLIVIWELRTEQEALDAGRDPALLGGSGLWPDFIMEYNPTTDAVDWEWHSWDHLVQEFDATKANYGVVSDHPELINLNYSFNGTNPDWQHINSVAYNEELDQILISSPFFNEIYIIDHSTTTAEAASHSGGDAGKGGDILWRWGNPEAYGMGDSTDQKLFFQHDAHWIPNGFREGNNILVFNNGRGRVPVEYSSVDILAPTVLADGNYVLAADDTYLPVDAEYSYSAPVQTDFYSRIISSAQMLPNGNILIDEGNQGHVFEIDSMDNLVWDYVIPVVQDSVLCQEDTVPGNPNIMFNGTFRARKYGFDFSGLTPLPLTDQGPIECDPYPSTCDITTVIEQEINRVELYPNPTTGMVYIINTSKSFTYAICNTAGELLAEGQLMNSIDLSSFMKGMYFIHVRDEKTDKQTILRVVKE